MVSAETCKRILKALDDNGYHKNALVRALRANRTHVVGIVVPNAGFHFYSEIVRAAEQEAGEHGFQCFLCQNHCKSGQIEKEINALREYRVDGIMIVTTSSMASPLAYRSLKQHKVPTVVVDVPIENVKTHFVGSDNFEAGRVATEHLLKLGHRRIAFLKGYHENPGAQERLKGYMNALLEFGISVEDDLMTGDGFEFESGQRAISTLLDRHISFSALIVSSDFAALGAVQELGRRGLRVPDDISLIGCGNLDFSAMVTPTLTTIDQHPLQLGRQAMHLLVDQIEGRAKASQKILVKPDLIFRESTASPSERPPRSMQSPAGPD
jgi:DNA-binding LacI/PurR family transcriptional regulator